MGGITRDDFIIAAEGGVVIKFNGTALACPKGDWSFNETVAAIEDNIQNWCSQVEQLIASFSPGPRTIEIGGAMEMLVGNATYNSMKTAMRNADECTMGYEATPSGGGTSESETFTGFLTQFNRTFRGQGPSDIQVNFRANVVGGGGG